MRNDQKRFGLSVSLAIAATGFLLAVSPESAYAQPCGSTITASLVLESDVGPCSQTALKIPAGADHITVDLNGFKIIGTGEAGSVGIESQAGLVTIQGPGTIFGFDVGIHVIEPASWWSVRGTTVQDLSLESNRVGVAIDGIDGLDPPVYGLNRILNNAITGPGETGIRIYGSISDEVRDNSVSGQNQYGIQLLVTRHSVVAGNTATDNNTGMYFDYWCDFARITGNEASNNQQDGIQSIAHGSFIEDNVTDRNGRDGMSLTHWLVRLSNNYARHNGRRGISLASFGADPPVGPEAYHVTGNTARHNETDLFWDGQGTKNCWADNKFKTSLPDQLPACP